MTSYSEMLRNRERNIPCRNVSDTHPQGGQEVIGIEPGGVGWASIVDIELHRETLKPITIIEGEEP